MRISALFFALAVTAACPAFARSPQCQLFAQGSLETGNDRCVAAHVYDVVSMENGTRFLDLCSPEIPDSSCHFSIVSYASDVKHVGSLEFLRGQDISVRGPVRRVGEHSVMILNDQRQLHGNPARFLPDPRLLGESDAEGRQPDDAPELRVNFHHHGKKLEP